MPALCFVEEKEEEKLGYKHPENRKHTQLKSQSTANILYSYYTYFHKNKETITPRLNIEHRATVSGLAAWCKETLETTHLC